jgi:hypothetical protein
MVEHAEVAFQIAEMPYKIATKRTLCGDWR